MNYGKATSNIREQLATYITRNKIKSLILGVSGGMDSCLCAALAKPVCDELKILLIGRSLPIQSNAPDEIKRAALTGKAFCHNFEEVNLVRYFNELTYINPNYSQKEFTEPGTHAEDVEWNEKETKAWKIRNGNIKARLRMIYLYNLASTHNGMVLSTDNYTEYLLGFWTLHGDVGDFSMIQYLWKSEVYDMAEWLAEYECKFLDEQEVLRMTIDALATDGLGVTSLGDLGQILPDFVGSSREGYKEVDQILQNYKKGSTLFKDASVYERHQNTEFKRNNPVNIKREDIFN